MAVDEYRHKGLRKRLIDELRAEGAFSEIVLEAMGTVPRHFFLDSAFVELAYENRALPIDANQTISHPSTVAHQSTLLDLEKGSKVLEIGTGCGYQTAVLLALGFKVYSIERHLVLHQFAKKILSKISNKAYLSYGDGFKGIPALAPYDGIIVTCGAPEVPESLLGQLAIGGKMIIPVNAENDEQNMVLIKRISENEFEKSTTGKFRFVPMLERRV